MGLFPPADYWRWAEEVDVISDDSYPDPNDPESFRLAALTRDLMRSLKPGTPWLLMEQSSNALSWRPTTAPTAPGQMAALSAQAVGRGADGILFFQWRQSRRGSEKFHSAMLPHAGTGTRIWREITRLGAELAALPPLPAPGRARVAIVFEWPNWWAISSPDHPLVLDYAALVQRWYSTLHRQHVSVDFVQSTSDLSAFALVVLPQSYLLMDAGAANLSAFVDSGGHLLVSAFSDVVDESDAFRPGGFTVGLRAVLGIAVEEFGALVPPGDTAPGERSAPVTAPFGELRGEYFAEEIIVLDEVVEVLGSFSGGRLSGLPALTSRASASGGEALYLATIPDDDGMRVLLGWAAERAGVAPEIAGLSEWVEVARRGDLLTLINHGVDRAVVPVAGTDLRSGVEGTQVTLDRFDWAVIRVEEHQA
jgi:beta-galactosidase